jgi:hypothetical protein
MALSSMREAKLKSTSNSWLFNIEKLKADRTEVQHHGKEIKQNDLVHFWTECNYIANEHGICLWISKSNEQL